MSKRLILVLALAFVVGIAFAAYAEVQNVKVSGDITVYGIARDNYSVAGSGGGRVLTLTGAQTESRDNYMTATRLRIDADLTDNVAATVRLINERDWGVADDVYTNATDTTTNRNSNIDLDLAYVTLKEFLYSPMTLKVGKQDLRIGSGLVIGDGVLTDPAGLLESDMSSRKAFDAIVALLDYDPLTLVLGIAKLSEAPQGTTDDTDAYIFDAVYKFKDYNAVADLSYILAHDSSSPTATSATSTLLKGGNTHIMDLRLTAQPIKNLSTELEYAREFGDYAIGRSLNAWALTAGANYAFAGVKYSPALGLKYDYRSGEEAGTTTGDHSAWKALYEDQVNGVIYDPNTNISIIKVSGSMKPMEDIILAADYYNYRYAEKLVASAASKGKKDAGDELDLSLTYNYTEDVSFGLLGAMFWPGSDYIPDNKKATEILGSMKVTF
jgi:hypothetical protein